MATEALALLVKLNIAASAAIALVFLLRPGVRRGLGANQTYALWLTVPLAMAGSLIPPGEALGPIGELRILQGRAEAWLHDANYIPMLAAAWALGVVISVSLVAWRYRRFLAEARSGRAGPAIVGVLAPRLVTPADFQTRFTADERRLVRAHERAHMDRMDPRWNAIALALQCLNWFNPMVHAGARAMMFDQELACDATVMTRHPAERRRYAETLLRSQYGSIVSPLGCGWTGRGPHPLVTRLTTLLQRRPGDRRRSLGDALVGVLWAAALAGAWAIQPPHRHAEATTIVLLDLTPEATAAAPLEIRPEADSR